MAAPYHGKTGNAQIGLTDMVNLQSWSLNITNDTSDVTAMGDAWAVTVAGLKDFSISADGKSQKALDTCALVGADAELVLGLDTAGPGFTGNAVLTSLTETVNFESEGTISWGFDGNEIDGIVYGAATGTAPTASANAFHGKSLIATFATTPIPMPREWSVSLAAETADTTSGHATTNGRTRLPGVKSGTATVTAVANGAISPAIGTTGALKLSRSATVGDGAYSGSAICTGTEITVDRSGTSLVKYSFTFTGAVTIVTA